MNRQCEDLHQIALLIWWQAVTHSLCLLTQPVFCLCSHFLKSAEEHIALHLLNLFHLKLLKAALNLRTACKYVDTGWFDRRQWCCSGHNLQGCLMTCSSSAINPVLNHFKCPENSQFRTISIPLCRLLPWMWVIVLDDYHMQRWCVSKRLLARPHPLQMFVDQHWYKTERQSNDRWDLCCYRFSFSLSLPLCPNIVFIHLSALYSFSSNTFDWA